MSYPHHGPCIESDDIATQRAWSKETFGPHPRTNGTLDHIRKELAEIEAEPDNLEEWIDVAILALDGAWRAGHSPEEIVRAYKAKLARNMARTWPDWRTAEPGKAIEHIEAGAEPMSERTSNETADPVGPCGDVPSLLARAQEWLGCVEDDGDCATHEPCAWPCRSQVVVSLAALLADVAAEGAADGIEGLMHELDDADDAELAARRADQWRAQARATGADQ